MLKNCSRKLPSTIVRGYSRNCTGETRDPPRIGPMGLSRLIGLQHLETLEQLSTNGQAASDLLVEVRFDLFVGKAVDDFIQETVDDKPFRFQLRDASALEIE